MKTPVATYGLCEGVQRGDKYKIRMEANPSPKRFEDDEEVEIIDFVDPDKGRPPCCRNNKARLLKFKGYKDPQWHPLWIIDCSKCPFYDLEWHWPGPTDYVTKGDTDR